MVSLGIYVQVPFCASKCSFCNFSSRVAPSDAFDDYFRALIQEIEGLKRSYDASGIDLPILDLPVNTLYWGGGTPSLLGAARLRKLVEALGSRFHFDTALEFTLEVAPGSAGDDFLEQAQVFGANRLSIGAQSFDDRELRAVGRLHSTEDTRALVSHARRAGFRNINLDLIAGLPYQTEGSWLESVRAAVRLNPEHISVYLFEIDQKSRLGREVLNEGTRYRAAHVSGEDFMADAYERAREALARGGYIQYEISNFALPGRESRHNQKYWRLEPYVGLGAGAHSFSDNLRWANATEVEAYQAKLARGDAPIAEIRRLSPEEQVEEFFFLGLRQRVGVDLALAKQRWGSTRLSQWDPAIAALEGEGWIEAHADWIRLPERAYLVSNEIFERFLTA